MLGLTVAAVHSANAQTCCALTGTLGQQKGRVTPAQVPGAFRRLALLGIRASLLLPRGARIAGNGARRVGDADTNANGGKSSKNHCLHQKLSICWFRRPATGSGYPVNHTGFRSGSIGGTYYRL